VYSCEEDRGERVLVVGLSRRRASVKDRRSLEKTNPTPVGRAGVGETIVSYIVGTLLFGDKQLGNLVVVELVLACAGVDHQRRAIGRDPDEMIAQPKDLP
jgi:hypothetical protein